MFVHHKFAYAFQILFKYLGGLGDVTWKLTEIRRAEWTEIMQTLCM